MRQQAAVPAEDPGRGGSLFSASGKYRNCLRINVALPPTEKHREALKKLGEAIVIAMEEG